MLSCHQLFNFLKSNIPYNQLLTTLWRLDFIQNYFKLIHPSFLISSSNHWQIIYRVLICSWNPFHQQQTPQVTINNPWRCIILYKSCNFIRKVLVFIMNLLDKKVERKYVHIFCTSVMTVKSYRRTALINMETLMKKR